MGLNWLMGLHLDFSMGYGWDSTKDSKKYSGMDWYWGFLTDSAMDCMKRITIT